MKNTTLAEKDTSVKSATNPKIEISRDQAYVSGSASYAGDYSVNVCSGKLNFIKSLATLDGNKMPLDLSIAYNPEFANATSINNIPTLMPKGWKFNYQQYVYMSGSNYIYVDNLFNFHRFVPSLNNSQVLFEESGSGLVMNLLSSGLTIKDDTNNTLYFDSTRRLYKIEKALGSTKISTTITYPNTTLQIGSITDVMGRTTTFSYGTNSITITKPDGKNISMTTSSSLLTSIIDTNNAVDTYTYNSSNQLLSAKCASGEKVTFTYGANDIVSAVQESVHKTSNVLTTNYDFNYQNMQTVVSKRKTTASENNKIDISYAYDAEGRITTSFEITGHGNTSIQQVVRGDYYRQVNTVSDRIRTAMFNSSKSVTLSNSSTSATSSIMEELEVVGEKEYIFSASFKQNDLGAQTGNKMAYAELKNGSELLATLNFNLDSTATQVQTARFSKATATTLSQLKVSVYLSFYIGQVEFSDCSISAMVQDKEQDCISVYTGEPAFYNETDEGVNVNWYPLNTPVQITYGSTSTVLTGAKLTCNDFRANSHTATHNSSSYYFWYNDRKGLIANTSNVKVKYGTGSLTSITALRFAMITKSPSHSTIRERVCSTTSTKYIQEYQRDNMLQGITTHRSKQYLYYNNKFLLVKTRSDNDLITDYTYDSWGNTTNVAVYNESATTNAIRRTSTYSDSGGYPASDTIYNGSNSLTTSYIYNFDSDNLTDVRSPRNQTTSYDYKANNVELSKISSNLGGDNSNQFNYTSGLTAQLTHNAFSYNIGYNSYNDINQVNVGGATFITKNYGYTADLDTVETVSGNGQRMRNTYNKYGKLIKIEEYVNSAYTTKMSYIYCDDGVNCTNITSPTSSLLEISATSKLRKTIDYFANITYNYVYDDVGNIEAVKIGTANYITNHFDNKNRLDSQSIIIGDDTHSYTITYTDDDAANIGKIDESRTSLGTTAKTWVSFGVDRDGLERVTNIKTMLGSSRKLHTDYTYKADTVNNGTTNLLNTAAYSTQNGIGAKVAIGTDTFNYDSDLNITGISTSGNVINNNVSYVYDKLNRLTRENNSRLNKTYAYTYDVGGNITSKKEYAYTTGTLGTPTATYSYTYPTSGWKDRLSTWNGYTFAYDNAGNPTTYKGNTLTWTRGRLLASYAKYIAPHTFDYNADGLRLYKNYEYHVRHATERYRSNYIYYGNKLLVETREYTHAPDDPFGTDPYVHTANKLVYIYTHQGLVGFTYDNTPYYYLKNTLGDIIAIYNASNVLVGSYTYDAWGNCTIGTNTNDIANINPFRYRGYYWDEDLQLYYLQTRYYDPEIGRFISADDISYLEPDTVNGLNLYAYCLNNPINTQLDSALAIYEGADSTISTTKVNNANANTSSRIVQGSKIHIDWPKVNAVVMTHHTEPLLINNRILGAFFGNVSYTVTTQLNDAKTFYLYSDIGNDGFRSGIGINIENWLGANGYVSSNIGIGFGVQITPWVTAGAEVSLIDGVTVSVGRICGKTISEVSVNIGWGSVLGFALVGALGSACGGILEQKYCLESGYGLWR